MFVGIAYVIFILTFRPYHLKVYLPSFLCGAMVLNSWFKLTSKFRLQGKISTETVYGIKPFCRKFHDLLLKHFSRLGYDISADILFQIQNGRGGTLCKGLYGRDEEILTFCGSNSLQLITVCDVTKSAGNRGKLQMPRSSIWNQCGAKNSWEWYSSHSVAHHIKDQK